MLPQLQLGGRKSRPQLFSKVDEEFPSPPPKLSLLKRVGEFSPARKGIPLSPVGAQLPRAGRVLEPIATDALDNTPILQRAEAIHVDATKEADKRAARRVREARKLERQRAKDEEEKKQQEEREREARYHKSATDLDAQRREIARRAAQRHRREREEGETLQQEHIKQGERRRVQLQKYRKPSSVRDLPPMPPKSSSASADATDASSEKAVIDEANLKTSAQASRQVSKRSSSRSKSEASRGQETQFAKTCSCGAAFVPVVEAAYCWKCGQRRQMVKSSRLPVRDDSLEANDHSMLEGVQEVAAESQSAEHDRRDEIAADVSSVGAEATDAVEAQAIPGSRGDDVADELPIASAECALNSDVVFENGAAMTGTESALESEHLMDDQVALVDDELAAGSRCVQDTEENGVASVDAECALELDRVPEAEAATADDEQASDDNAAGDEAPSYDDESHAVQLDDAASLELDTAPQAAMQCDAEDAEAQLPSLEAACSSEARELLEEESHLRDGQGLTHADDVQCDSDVVASQYDDDRAVADQSQNAASVAQTADGAEAAPLAEHEAFPDSAGPANDTNFGTVLESPLPQAVQEEALLDSSAPLNSDSHPENGTCTDESIDPLKLCEETELAEQARVQVAESDSPETDPLLPPTVDRVVEEGDAANCLPDDVDAATGQSPQ
eukprot:TRINITY_DN16638_c0_g2_i1.p1 TRINITY_DN16638_c0_g2~~TRINITY_DN16638_c0_g2_i1.p1  ORF type:complete len:676 (+),score=135.84 TRINITY_DN16638_c0_g2_i1:72-2099(+)